MSASARRASPAFAILRVRSQVPLDELPSLLVPGEIEERPCDLIIPEGQIRLWWHLLEDLQSLLVLPTIDEGDPDAAQGMLLVGTGLSAIASRNCASASSMSLM